MNYVIAASRDWNKSLLDTLRKELLGDWEHIKEKKDLNSKWLKEFNPRYIFFPHWSYIIPKEIYEDFNCVVFHMTDLPFGRGGSPLQNLISSGIFETKVSALKVDEGLDTGDVYLKKNLSLHGTAEEIFLRASHVIEEMIIEIVQKELLTTPQEGEPVLFKRRTPEMSDIKDVNSIELLFDHIRMLDAEGYPNAYFENEHFKFEFTRASRKSNETIIADVRISKK